ncbi:hypothetical protein ACTI_83910 [Actinoplanes sp. OR16]|uniref:hypothetical protein n=1 Tax=Actinoplanes sp. OR16 TaxID=946334 RepID=UPI000F6FB86E|nr:hypothetical protein [Actinoplanes sp. OR16]BBH71706.1 hypothetical protein ACTI_83910 [Actinoplanes sp. OR16]
MEEPYRPVALRVMAEHVGEDPVWDSDPDHMGQVDLASLGVSEDLIARLNAWNDEFISTALTDFEFSSPDAEERWRRTGLELAYELQNQLPDVEISYFDDEDDRPLRQRRGPFRAPHNSPRL